MIAIGIALVVSFLVAFLMKYIAYCVVWVSIVGTVLALCGMGFVFLYNGGVFADFDTLGDYLGTLGIPTL